MFTTNMDGTLPQTPSSFDSVHLPFDYSYLLVCHCGINMTKKPRPVKSKYIKHIFFLCGCFSNKPNNINTIHNLNRDWDFFFPYHFIRTARRKLNRHRVIDMSLNLNLPHSAPPSKAKRRQRKSSIWNALAYGAIYHS